MKYLIKSAKVRGRYDSVCESLLTFSIFYLNAIVKWEVTFISELIDLEGPKLV